MVFKFLASQFIEVIEWLDNTSNTMVYRFPVRGNEIKMGAQLTVRESQMAIFVNEGQIADVFSPGRYELSTENMPILTKLKSWKYGFKSPFKAEVYFVNTKQFTDQKWGTSNPVMMRDQDFGMIRLRGYGIYSYKVKDPVIFLKEVFGTNEEFDVETISKQLKKIIVSGLSDLLAESQIPALDFSMNYDELSEAGKQKFIPKFEEYGFELKSFYIENLSLPKEVEEAMDRRTSMGVLGNVDNYAKFQAADAIRDAAKNEGGGFAGAGVGLGAGAAMGQMFTNSFSNSNTSGNVENDKLSTETISCPKCQKQNIKGAKFCVECGTGLQVEEESVPCIECGAKLKVGAKFCTECGAKQERNCPNCNAKLGPNSKFCPECGTKA